jgi:hypothetical protein
VTEVEQKWADKFSALEGKPIGRKAYECRICEALIYEDELDGGKFAPKQPRRFWT